jgi:acyl-coenzyme A synthetase/AMP-(fatty) acid ligase
MSYSCEFLLERFAGAPDAIAFVDNDEQFTFSWILERVPEYVLLLNDVGVNRGDVVVVLADYSPHVFCLMLAAINGGVIMAPITRDSVVEADAIRDISEARWYMEFSEDIEKIQVERLPGQGKSALLRDLRFRDRPGLLLFSSGSTGDPKGILLDFGSVLEKFRVPRPRVTAISFLMLDHFGGINTLFHIASNLGTVVTVRERSVRAVCEAIERHRVELLPTTPSFLNVLVHSDVGSRYDLSSLRTISYGTEVMPQATLDRLAAMFPEVKLQQTYGLSEVGVLRSKSRPDGSLWLQVGGEGFQTQVREGVLWIKSDYAMVGYLNAPSPFDEDGWFNTQDRVEVDGEYIRILGRTTDLINVGGQKVYPAEVEDVIIGLENIEDVRVFGERNALVGNVVVAEVVLKSPENAADLKIRIRRACREVLADFKVPAKVTEAQSGLYTARHKKLRR